VPIWIAGISDESYKDFTEICSVAHEKYRNRK
jgi:hypothetical protein